jgi:hypothetical protein
MLTGRSVLEMDFFRKAFSGRACGCSDRVRRGAGKKTHSQIQPRTELWIQFCIFCKRKFILPLPALSVNSAQTRAGGARLAAGVTAILLIYHLLTEASLFVSGRLFQSGVGS